MLQRPGAIVAGKYRLEKPLARGGVGTVWTAHHVQLGHAVAVKFLDPRVASSAQVRTRFEREARAAAHLRTPHIVQVFDYGIQSDTPYLVMELLQGETLHARLRKVKRLSLGDAYRVLVQMGKGLRRAHEVGFVHRDLKPANIYLCKSEDDDEEVVKILDFGIAKEAGVEVGESTKTGELVGSPHYMSPEQIRGEREVDARSDLWALGVILFKAVTGELPFPGEVLTAVITKIVVDPIPPARAALPEAPEALDVFFARAFARDRAQRFQNVRELVAAFREIAALEAGAAGADALSPLSLTGAGPRSLLPSMGDVPSLFPAPLSSSFPGPASGAQPGAALGGSLTPPPVPSISTLGDPGSSPGSHPGGSFAGGLVPGGSIPGSYPGGSYTGGAIPGGSIPGSYPGALPPPSSMTPTAMSGGVAPAEARLPGSATPISMAGGGAAPVPEARLPLPSTPSLSGVPGLLGPSSSPTFTAGGAAIPPAAAQPARRSRWVVGAALGAGLLLVVGLAIGALRLRGSAGGTAPEARPAAGPAAEATAAATAEPASAPGSAAADQTASAEPAATAAPAVSAEPSTAATAPSSAPATPSAVKGRGGPGFAKPAVKGKKPVDTID